MENKYIEISKNKWERVYLSADEFKKDFESLFNDYKSIYQDARIIDLAKDIINHYNDCLSNVRYLEFTNGQGDIQANIEGVNIIDELQKTFVKRGNIDHKIRKGLQITFNNIVDYLESIIKHPKQKTAETNPYPEVFKTEKNWKIFNEWIQTSEDLKSDACFIYWKMKDKGMHDKTPTQYIKFLNRIDVDMGDYWKQEYVVSNNKKKIRYRNIKSTISD